VLLAQSGLGPVAIGRVAGVTRLTAALWRDRYLAGGLAALEDGPGRGREADRREDLDRQFVEDFARRVRRLFPNAPEGRELAIAEHACLKYSGRVGRSAAAKALGDDAVRLAVAAHVRHAETRYDTLPATGRDRAEARREVQADLARIMNQWGT
jgi:hypothetical protein